MLRRYDILDKSSKLLSSKFSISYCSHALSIPYNAKYSANSASYIQKLRAPVLGRTNTSHIKKAWISSMCKAVQVDKDNSLRGLDRYSGEKNARKNSLLEQRTA
jgi:hypothetical protein